MFRTQFFFVIATYFHAKNNVFPSVFHRSSQKKNFYLHAKNNVSPVLLRAAQEKRADLLAARGAPRHHALLRVDGRQGGLFIRGFDMQKLYSSKVIKLVLIKTNLKRDKQNRGISTP